jgi:anti-sigma regulatory factor (Ser/Thr protein kinase)
MNGEVPGLQIRLPARPANVAVVRHAVAGLAEQMGMGEPSIGDLKTVVTEACMNVVVHAYGDGEGPLEVEAFFQDDGLTVCVRDFGDGIRPRPDVEQPSLRIGLTLIAALSSSFEIAGGLGRGTEVKMHLVLKPGANGNPPPAALRAVPVADAAELTIGRPDLAASVLERVVGALAARHSITVDRLNDAMLLTDAVSARAPEAFGQGGMRFAVIDGNGGIDLRIGPMPEGASRRLLDGLALPQVGGTLEALADEMRIEQDDNGEYVVVRFASLAAD